MKKTYQAPCVEVNEIGATQMICESENRLYRPIQGDNIKVFFFIWHMKLAVRHRALKLIN